LKFLFLSSYYKPELTSSARRTNDLHEAIVARGYTIELYCPTPTRGVTKEVRKEYKKRKFETERGGSMTVRRFPLWREGRSPLLRALRYVVCEFLFCWYGLWTKDVDILSSGSTPPIHGLSAVVLTKLCGIPFVYYLADIFPDSLVGADMTCEGSLVWKIGSWISDIIYRNASRIIVISDSMKNVLVSRGVPADKIDIIYLWIDQETTRSVARTDNRLFDEFNLPRDKFYVTYAGNFGASQNVELLLDCADKLRDMPQIQFVIFGDGSQKQKLVQKIADQNLDSVKLFPMQPSNRVSEVYSLGDVSFVTCYKNVGGGAFPSKAAVIMGTGTPLVASYNEDSDLCALITRHEAGLCTEPESVDAAVDAIRRLYTDPELRTRCAENGRKLVNLMFSKASGVAATLEVYEKAARSCKESVKKNKR